LALLKPALALSFQVREDLESRNHLCWSEVWFDDEIENDSYVALFSFCNHAVEIGERAVHGIDVFVVGDVIAEVNLRGREARGDPNGVDAEVFQVIELRGDALEVADAVIVAVGEAARIDFVEDGVLPPLVAFGIKLLLGACARRPDTEGKSQQICRG
jgi:hypothetical protein